MSTPTIERSNSESNNKFGEDEKTKNEQIHEFKLIPVVVVILGYLHIGAIYGLYLAFTSAKIATILFSIFVYQIGIWGVTAGAHRLWSHRSYKAKWPLRLLLLIMFSTTYQYSAIHWARDHRVHHKYTDTNADPYNSKRGFVYSQLGWAFLKKHPDVAKRGDEIDMSDLYNDPLANFQHKNAGIVLLLFAFILPTLIPMYCWNETLANSFFVASALRWACGTHAIGLINSAAHMFGYKPYDKNLTAVENITVAILAGGEGWHNYHHAFPWDYSSSEFGKYWNNSAASFIKFFEWVGWAYDLKTVSADIVQKRAQRTGDGSHPVWGWMDKDMTKEDRNAAIVSKRK